MFALHCCVHSQTLCNLETAAYRAIQLCVANKALLKPILGQGPAISDAALTSIYSILIDLAFSQQEQRIIMGSYYSTLRRSSQQEAPPHCSIEALSIQEVVILEDILHNDGVASVLIHFLELEDKRNLRLVCHAGKDAVDKTVTCVYMLDVIIRLHRNFAPKPKPGIGYARILSKSNWKGIKSLAYSPWQDTDSGKYYESQGLNQILEAGLAKLESLALILFDDNKAYIPSVDKLVKAGWKLKVLDIDKVPSEWFGTLVRDANWPLESLTIHECTESIAALIAESDWKLKGLSLPMLSPEAVETLMQGSWVSTVEKLDLTFNFFCQSGNTKDSKGVIAISQASHRALNLLELRITTSEFDNYDALILAEGTYPNLERFTLIHLLNPMSINVSGIAAILRKCPKLEKVLLFIGSNNTLYAVDDVEDAKLVAEYYKNGVIQFILDDVEKEFKAYLADYL